MFMQFNLFFLYLPFCVYDCYSVSLIPTAVFNPLFSKSTPPELKSKNVFANRDSLLVDMDLRMFTMPDSERPSLIEDRDHETIFMQAEVSEEAIITLQETSDFKSEAHSGHLQPHGNNNNCGIRETSITPRSRPRSSGHSTQHQTGTSLLPPPSRYHSSPRRS
jgi:hypothetical protein